MDGKVLRKLNRRLLTSLNLTSRAAGNDAIVSAAESCCGINSQHMQDSFSSFWARTHSFSNEDLKQEMKPEGGLVRTWTVRGTVHTFPSRDYYMHVFGSPRERSLSRHDSYARQLGIPSREERIKRFYLPLLDEINREPVTSDYIGEFIAEKLTSMGVKGKRYLSRGWTSERTYGPTWEGLSEMSYLGMIVNAGRVGSKSLWMSTEKWLKTRPKSPDPEECATELIRSYIERYGPVTFTDIVYWSGHRKKDAKNALDALKDQLTQESLGNSGEIYYSFDGHTEYEEPPEAIVLPRFDSLLMGYSDKSRVMPVEKRDMIFVNAGIINPTVLIDGFVAGIWKKEKKGKMLRSTVTSFRKLGDNQKKSVGEKFEEYAEYMQTDLDVKFRVAS